MASQFFDQLTGPLVEVTPNSNWYGKNTKYGISCDVEFERSDTNKQTGNRLGAAFTNVLTTFGKFNVELIDDLYIADGINTKMLDDYGKLDKLIIQEQLRLHTAFRPDSCNNVAEAIAFQQQENHVTVLVNLLRWFIIKEADESIGHKVRAGHKDKLSFKPEDIFYDDGHVSMSYEQFYQTKFSEKIEMKIGEVAEFTQFSEGIVPNEFFFMPNLIGFKERELAILGKYMSEIKCNHPSRLAFSTPRLATMIYIKNGMQYPLMMHNVVEDETSKEIYDVLCKYVYANRCQSQFDLAYSFIVMAMYAPMPRAIEANGWISPVNKMYLPKAGSVRGVIPAMTQGIAFTKRPEAELTFNNWMKNRHRIYVHAIAACEALYGGMFEIMTSGGKMVTAFFEVMGVTSVTMATPWRIMQECAAYRFGKAFESNWDTLCGPDMMAGLLSVSPEQHNINVTPATDVSGYEIYQVEVDGVKISRIRAAAIKPALFPVLSYGVNDDRYYINKREYTAKMMYRPDIGCLTTTSPDQANKMMNILRIMGHDCTVKDGMTGAVYKNWAANSNGQVMPVFNPYDSEGAYAMPVSSIRARQMCWMPLGPISRELNIKIRIDVRSYIVFSSGKNVGRFMTNYTPVVRIPKQLLDGTVSAFTVRTQAQTAPYSYQDFLLAITRMPEENPSLSLAVAAIEPSLPSEEEMESAGLMEMMQLEAAEA